jgi:hypothetical protein
MLSNVDIEAAKQRRLKREQEMQSAGSSADSKRQRVSDSTGHSVATVHDSPASDSDSRPAKAVSFSSDERVTRKAGAAKAPIGSTEQVQSTTVSSGPSSSPVAGSSANSLSVSAPASAPVVSVTPSAVVSPADGADFVLSSEECSYVLNMKASELTPLAKAMDVAVAAEDGKKRTASSIKIDIMRKSGILSVKNLDFDTGTFDVVFQQPAAQPQA